MKDNDFSAWISHVAGHLLNLEGGYTRSVPYNLNTFSFGIGFNPSDTPRKAGGLMDGAASKAVARNVQFVCLPAAVRTPQGLKVSSRGQRHAFCACRPRTAPPFYRP
jgi:hypothetical protein